MAIVERGVEATVPDPARGSGHLLLRAYDWLYETRRRAEPGPSAKESAKRALSQLLGIDLNPYATATARFRLLLSYFHKAGLKRLAQVLEALPLKVYLGIRLVEKKNRPRPAPPRRAQNPGECESPTIPSPSALPEHPVPMP